MKTLTTLLSLSILLACEPISQKDKPEVIPEYTLPSTHKHNKWSRTIAPVLSVPSGAIVEAFTEEATDAQLNVNSTIEDMANVSFDPIHPLTGPIYVEEAQPGDVLAVTMHKIEVGNWGWSAIFPGFGFLADTYTKPYLKTFKIDSVEKVIHFSEKIKIPTRPFAGVMGVAPDTDSLLSTIPPRANGGNMDDPNMVEGTTVYFPIFVEGALFSIGDAHAVQGMGEVSGTAVESPMRFVFELKLLKGQKSYLNEPQYETDDYYAVTAFGTTIDIATRKAVQYMIEYLVNEHGLTEEDAYILCSLAGDLKIAEVVDVPNMLVTMHISKEVLGIK
ncbi:MAG: acetamidase/formamidase family protein [Reichenbachiella sp.]|uniref:acetamidase/formamidase family protein n=2 Tax=Reichenbachiella sp. TaxID=2184521 RepID=UPI0032986BDE